jgi:hypothetical protein
MDFSAIITSTYQEKDQLEQQLANPEDIGRMRISKSKL